MRPPRLVVPRRRLLIPAFVAAAIATTAPATPAADGVPISGGSAAQRQVVRTVLAKLRSQRITAVTFKPHAHMLGITNGQRMDVSGIDGTVRTHWDEQLFVAAYLRESLTRRAPEPKEIVMNGDRFVPVHGPRHPGRIPPPGPRASAKVIAAYVSSMRDAAATAKAQVVSVDVMRPGPIGVALTLRVPDPASFLKHRTGAVLQVISQPPTGVLSTYVGLQSSSGKLVWELARFPTGTMSFIAPNLRGCNPIPVIGPVGYGSPPCPAK